MCVDFDNNVRVMAICAFIHYLILSFKCQIHFMKYYLNIFNTLFEIIFYVLMKYYLNISIIFCLQEEDSEEARAKKRMETQSSSAVEDDFEVGKCSLFIFMT